MRKMGLAYSMERSAARSDIITCAAMEAGAFYGRGIVIEEILDAVENKYSENVPDIREIILEKLQNYVRNPHEFGTVSDIDRTIIADIRKSIEKNSVNV